MSYLNGVVDRVYVINLDKDTERMKSIDRQFKAAGIQYTRISAIEGSKVKHTNKLTEYCLQYCTDGMKGCALSHRLIWDDMVSAGYSKVAVFEDDAIISETFQDELKVAWSQLPKDFDICYTGCSFQCGDSHPTPKIINALSGNTPERYDKNIMSVAGSFGTHGYIISKKCATLFQNLTINGHIDSEIGAWIKKFNLKAYSIDPLIVKTAVPEYGTGTNLSESFPPMLNYLLFNIPISDTYTLDWGLSENFMKLGPYNINALLIICTIITLLIPLQYAYILAIWLLVEFFASRDLKNTGKFAVFMGIAWAIKWRASKDIKYPSKR